MKQAKGWMYKCEYTQRKSRDLIEAINPTKSELLESSYCMCGKDCKPIKVQVTVEAKP